MKVLVLGDGLLGSELVKKTGWNNVSRKKNKFDITVALKNPNWKYVLVSYDVIVNCIAHTDTYVDSRELHWNVNYKGVHDLVEFCNNNDIKLVHIGTDQLYAGNTKLEPTEEDVPVHAENWYAYTKILADGMVQLESNNYLICRGTHKDRELTDWEYGFVDKVGNFDYVDVISEQIIKLIEDNEVGIWNVGTELKSAYDLINQIQPTIKPGLAPNNMPKKTTMSIKKINEKIKTNLVIQTFL